VNNFLFNFCPLGLRTVHLLMQSGNSPGQSVLCRISMCSWSLSYTSVDGKTFFSFFLFYYPYSSPASDSHATSLAIILAAKCSVKLPFSSTPTLVSRNSCLSSEVYGLELRHVGPRLICKWADRILKDSSPVVEAKNTDLCCAQPICM